MYYLWGVFVVSVPIHFIRALYAVVFMPLKVFYEVFLGSITIQSLIRKIASSRLYFCSCMAARHIDVPKYVPSCKHESHIYGHLHGSESLQVFVSRAQHQFNTIQLINLTCTRVIIDRHDIGAWMTMTKLLDNTFAYDMVWQANGWVHTMFGVSFSISSSISAVRNQPSPV